MRLAADFEVCYGTSKIQTVSLSMTTAFMDSLDLKTRNTNLISQYVYPDSNHVPGDLVGRVEASTRMGRIMPGNTEWCENTARKNFVFGADNALFKAQLRDVIGTYTDFKVVQPQHQSATDLAGGAHPRGTVISSFGYAPVDPTIEPSAVDEMRDPEILWEKGELDAIIAALDAFFALAEARSVQADSNMTRADFHPRFAGPASAASPAHGR